MEEKIPTNSTPPLFYLKNFWEYFRQLLFVIV